MCRHVAGLLHDLIVQHLCNVYVSCKNEIGLSEVLVCCVIRLTQARLRTPQEQNTTPLTFITI